MMNLRLKTGMAGLAAVIATAVTNSPVLAAGPHPDPPQSRAGLVTKVTTVTAAAEVRYFRPNAECAFGTETRLFITGTPAQQGRTASWHLTMRGEGGNSCGGDAVWSVKKDPSPGSWASGRCRCRGPRRR
jgi:hypothetical protein